MRQNNAGFAMALCFGVLIASAARAEQGGDMIELRAMDEVVFKDGNIARGSIYETDSKEDFKIKSYQTNTVRLFNISETKEIRRKATAETELTRLAAANAGRPDAILRLAQEAARRFDHVTPKIIAMLEKEAASNNPQLLAFLCELYLQGEQTDKALAVAERVVSLASSSGRGYVLRARCLLAAEKLDAAEKDLDRAYKLAPDSEEILVARADFLMQSGRPDEAKKMFTNALAHNAKNVAAMVGLGMARLRQGEFKDAEESFQDALVLSPDHKQARLGLSAVKFMTKNYEEAYQEAERVLTRDNHSAQAFGLQAMSKLFTGDRDSLAVFEKDMDEAFREKANQPRLLLAWAAGLEREVLYDDTVKTKESRNVASDADDKEKTSDESKAKRELAAKKYAELMDSTAPDAFIQYFIGERKFKAGDFAGADAAFQHAIKLAPTYAPVHAAAGATDLKLGKWEAARDAYERAMKLDPATGEYPAGQGLALLKVQRLDEAAEAFRKASDLDAHNVTALCGLGWIANKHKNKSSAEEFFQHALSFDGSSAYAAEALRKIYAQDAMTLEYHNFDDNLAPTGWKMYGPGAIRPGVADGRLQFKGVQGSATGTRVEAYKEVKADEFMRLEADFEIDPASQVSFGMRLASTTGAATTFELELGKDEGHELKVRFKDYSGAAPEWKSLAKPGKEWPADGHVRLAIDTDDLKSGKMRLWINGKNAELNLVLQKPVRVTAGFFVQAPPKEVVRASVDNVLLLTRGAPASDKDSSETLIMIKDDEKKPAPPAPPAPAGNIDKPKDK